MYICNVYICNFNCHVHLAIFLGQTSTFDTVRDPHTGSFGILRSGTAVYVGQGFIRSSFYFGQIINFL